MGYPGTPVDVHPELGDIITKVVQRFTSNNNLDECIAWYHDEPIWFVKKKQQNVVIRVQVAAFHREDKYVIRLIPDAYLLENKRVVKHIGQDVIEKSIKTVKIPMGVPLGVPLPQFEKDLDKGLLEAWEEAKNLTSKFP